MKTEDLCVGVTMGTSCFSSILGTIFWAMTYGKDKHLSGELGNAGTILFIVGFTGLIVSIYMNQNRNLFFGCCNKGENKPLTTDVENRAYSLN